MLEARSCEDFDTVLLAYVPFSFKQIIPDDSPTLRLLVQKNDSNQVKYETYLFDMMTSFGATIFYFGGAFFVIAFVIA